LQLNGKADLMMARYISLSLTTLLALLVSASAAGVPSEGDQRLLALGSALGSERLQVLVWPDSGEVSRLKVKFLPSDQERPTTGRLGEYEILEAKPLDEAHLKLFANSLLDTEVYSSLGIRRPVRPGPYDRGAGTLCGGFQPIVGVRLKDLEDRVLDVLLCFSCHEIAFAVVERKGHTTPPERAPHFSISYRGAARLLRYLVEVFPDDKTLRWLRDDRERHLTEAGAA
jgi:hypothetical protein